MKQFNNPTMTIVKLVDEDVITTSYGCPENLCRGHLCPECVSCEGGFSCLVFSCPGKYTTDN